MSIPDLNPKSQQSKIVLPEVGNTSNVDSLDYPLPLGIYTSGFWEEYQVNSFKRGAADQVSYVYKKLGGDVLDLEITEAQVYAAYEESVLEYSYLVNIHQGKNILSNVLGASTGSFDEHGELLTPGDDGRSVKDVAPGKNVNLSYPRFDFAYARRMADGISEEVNMGGGINVYSASFDIDPGTQDYDLQTILRNSDEFGDDDEHEDFIRSIGDNKVVIKKVYWRTPNSSWYYYGGGGASVIGNWQSYGSYANDSYFHVVPVWETKLKTAEFENKLYNRSSHFSFEIKNNKLRLFPIPSANHPDKMWLEFSVGADNWEAEPTQEGEASRDIGLYGVNNINSLPFANLPYDKINAIGKQWIRRFALALSKEMLGHVRSKFGSIPIPGNDVQLNGSDLVSSAKEEQTALRDELKELLDELTYSKLIEGDAEQLENSNRVMAQIPMPIFTG